MQDKEVGPPIAVYVDHHGAACVELGAGSDAARALGEAARAVVDEKLIRLE